MSEVSKEHKDVDRAIDAYISSTNDVGSFVTGWFLVMSLSSPGRDTEMEDGYASITSDGLPHHAQLGLLTVAMDDKKNLTMLANIRSMLDEDYEDEDDEEQEEEYA